MAVGEPEVQVNLPASIVIKRGGTTITGGGKSLLDYFTIANLYEPCAALATAAVGSPLLVAVSVAAATNRCSDGTSAGQTLGANQIRSTSGSPVAVSAPRL